MAVRTYGPLRRGWRFCPNDEELIKYLREKNADELLEIEEIPDVDICKFEPEDLPGKSLIKTDDLEWFFFSPFKRKYQRGCRKDRMTNTGYWKVTGKDRNIKSQSSKLIGKKRTLVFYEGRAPRCERTNWIAHEYQTIENGVDGKKCEEVTTAEGLVSGSMESLPINAFHAMLPNHTESSSEEYPTYRSNMTFFDMIEVKDDWQDDSKNARRVASKHHIRSLSRIQLMEKTHRQCGDAEDHPVTTAIIVGRENGAVGTRVNGGLCSTELEEELEKRLATLQLADKTQAEASHNLEGKQKQIPSMMTVQAEERCEGIRE